MEKEKAIILIISITFFSVFGSLIGMYVYELQTNPILGGGAAGQGGYFLNLTIDYSNGTTEEYSNLNATNPLALLELKANTTYSPLYGDLYIDAVNQHYGGGWKYYVNDVLNPVPAKSYQFSSNYSVILWKCQ